MCGIAGELRWSGRPVAPTALSSMISAIAHRGPDGKTSWISDDGRMGMAHALLSFFTRGSPQPLTSASGRVFVVCNGEIYNHRSLTEQLRADGVALDPQSDVAVLPFLYDRYGTAAFAMLRGEFAFALYDVNAQTLFLVRDRFGIKPLHYALHQHGLLFGSEAKAVLAHPDMARAFDPTALMRSICSVKLPGRSLFAGVDEVKPGSFVRVQGARIAQEVYWSPEARPVLGRSDRELADTLESLLDAAVRLRLHGDYPVGAYLSAGIDSSAVLAGLVRAGVSHVKAFTIGFEEARFDERARAAATAKEFGIEHHVVDVRNADIAAHFLPSLWHNEIPVMNWHGTAKYLLARAAAQQVKAVVTGEGSDELFGGYFYFAQSSDAVWAERYPAILERFGGTPYVAVLAAERVRLMRPFLTPDIAAEISSSEMVEALLQDIRVKDVRGLSPVEMNRQFSLRHNLPGYTLNMCDRTEMSHGLEGRPPFLDDAVVDFALSLPSDAMSGRRGGKQVLRDAFAARLPDHVLTQAKWPLTAPSGATEAILTSETADMLLSQELTARAGIFAWEKLRWAREALYRMPANSAGQRHCRAVLILALSLHGLHHLFVEQRAAA
jgi:asparagine synthase (glutamine-hydrolysing)